MAVTIQMNFPRFIVEKLLNAANSKIFNLVLPFQLGDKLSDTQQCMCIVNRNALWFALLPHF